MIPSPPIHHRNDARRSDRLAPGSAHACAGPLVWPTVPARILSSKPRSARSRQHARPSFKPRRQGRRSRLNFSNTYADTKSP
jgi:hypothetical protein